MLLRRSLLLAIIFIATLSFAQTDKSKNVIAEFKGQKITWGEFENAYKKNDIINNATQSDTIPKLKNFLDLYVNYKMKLDDGIQRGIADDPEVINEIDGYKDQITNTFYIEKYLIEPTLRKLYERRKWELRGSHIMFVPRNGNDAESLKLANSVLDSLKNGAGFAEMAKKYSQDNFSKNYGGDFYYFTAGQLPKVIEDALFNTEEGKLYPQIVKSDFGYHIFKVTAKHLRKVQLRASHILIRYEIDGKTDTVKAKAIIDTVYQKIKAGEDFIKLVKEYSMDEGSKSQNGDLGFFSRNQMVRPFDDAVFNLQKAGDISGIVQTAFGYHIIKLTGISEFPAFEADRESLLKVLQARQYNEYYYELLDSLAEKNNYKVNKPVVEYILGIIDTAKGGFDIANLPDSVKEQTLYTLNNKQTSVKNYVDYLQQLGPEENKEITTLPFRKSMLRAAGDEIIKAEEPNLEKNDPKFREILSEYKKGVIIFKLQQQEVWNNINVDSLSVLNYFNQNAKKYMWPDRVKFTELFTLTDSLIYHYQKLIAEGENFDTLCTHYTERKGYKERGGQWALRDVNHNDLYQKAWSMKNIGGYSDIYKNFGGYSIVRLDQKDPAHIKTFEEARTEVTSDFQEYQTKKAEQAYLDKLKKKYNPKIYYDKIAKLYK